MNAQRTSSVIFAIVLLIVVGILVNACSTATPLAPTLTPTMSPVDLVKAYDDAYNHHDIVAVMGLMTEDVSLELGQHYYAWTRKETQAFLENYLFGLNSEVHHTDCSPSGDQVSCRAVFIDDWWLATGLTGYHFAIADFTLQENKIKKITYGNDQPSDLMTIINWSDKFEEWLLKNYPSEYDKLNSDLAASGEGQSISKRIKEYTATLK
jgi:hypothetical protein